MNERIASQEDPRSKGKTLTGPLLGAYWRYRVGDCRVICDLQDSVLCILMIEIGNRKEIYR
ncbi:MAG: type II toxin-antitoxin system RelE/ParE family toxin [Gammaproteobacteria bacterium]|nr:type II toxin-antitoxin system RelE/ParE family toxin [Gammaproteobacteria bacterium]